MPAPRVRRDQQRHGPVGVHVIGAVLRVVLDHKDCHFFPVPALRAGFDNPPECQVVGSHGGLGGEGAGPGPAGVVFSQRHDHEARKVILALEFSKLPNEHVCLFIVALAGRACGLPSFAGVPFQPRHTIHACQRARRVFRTAGIDVLTIRSIAQSFARAQIPDVTGRRNGYLLRKRLLPFL